jgi:hypothetical protein
MKLFNTKIHGVLDYLVAILLIASPWLFNFAGGGPATWVPVILGITTLLYSICTDYEAGLIKSIRMPAHLMLDGLSGIFLAASPWIFSFSDYVYQPHLWIGLIELFVALFTDKVSYASRQPRAGAGTFQQHGPTKHRHTV